MQLQSASWAGEQHRIYWAKNGLKMEIIHMKYLHIGERLTDEQITEISRIFEFWIFSLKLNLTQVIYSPVWEGEKLWKNYWWEGVRNIKNRSLHTRSLRPLNYFQEYYFPVSDEIWLMSWIFRICWNENILSVGD